MSHLVFPRAFLGGGRVRPEKGKLGQLFPAIFVHHVGHEKSGQVLGFHFQN